MASNLKIVALLLVALPLAACGERFARAPIDSRSNQKDSAQAPEAVTRPSTGSRAVSSSRPSVYLVKRGDTLSSIGRRYGMSYKEIARINGIPLPYNIHAGQYLRLKGKPGQNAGSAPVVKPRTTDGAATSTTSLPENTREVYVFDGSWQWPTRGRVLRGFKPNEPGKKGISIGGHIGQPIHAAANGKVVYVGSGLVGYGRLIIIRHNEDLLSTYGHNSELLVSEGEYVKAGQTIAKMGSSGNGRNELYFEIRKQGKPVNPSSYLPGKP